jgi:predicted transcriptional regulator
MRIGGEIVESSLPSNLRVLGEISQEPGITKQEVCGKTELAWGTINYHVDNLLDANLVKSFRAHPFCHLFLPEIPDEVLPAIAALRRPNADRIMENLGEPQQLRDLQQSVGIGKNAIRSHLCRFQDAKLVKVSQDKHRKYRVNEAFVSLVNQYWRPRL